MRFSEIYDIKLYEGITHIEDASIDKFLHLIRNFEEYEISEKVDGSNIAFGKDENGFYTTGPEKKKFYSVDQYPIQYSTTYRRSSHLALEQILSNLESAGLRTGDQVEAEVLFGELPNAIPYSKDTNLIVFLRVMEGDVNLKRLLSSVSNQKVSVTLEAPYTIDGKTIKTSEETHEWGFSKTPTKSGVSLSDGAKQKLEDALSKLDSYLKEPSGIYNFSNAEALSIPLNRRPKELSVAEWKDMKIMLKSKKDEIKRTLYSEEGGKPSGLKYNLKSVLLDELVRGVQSAFRDEYGDKGWIEGVVLSHKDSGDLLKVVDKEIFLKIKKFIWEVREKLAERPKSANYISSFLGDILVTLARSLGHPELGTNQVKRYAKKFGETREEIVSNLARDINVDEVKSYWIRYLEQKKQEFEKKLKEYSDTYKDKSLDVEFGQEDVRQVKYSQEVHNRTLQVFSQVYNQLDEMEKSVSNVNSGEELIMLLAGSRIG